MVFKTLWVLFFLPVLLVALFWWRKKARGPAISFPSLGLVASLPKSWKNKIQGVPFLLRVLALSLFVIALAGPRTVLEETKYHSEGIDIMLAIDASRSMAAEDFTLMGRRYSRLSISKKVVEDFIDGRKHDRIGLVAFAGQAYTVSPLTKDYEWLKENLRRIDFDLIADGTAIGSALSSSVIRLEKSKAKSKVIILLTDGVNNSGKVAPLEAAHAAEALGSRVYTIGAGTKGYAPYPVQDPFGRTVYQKVRTDVDEGTLQEIARVTGGKYFRATDTDSLRLIYHEIDQLEKTEIDEAGYRDYKELFAYCVAAALALLFLELLLTYTVFLRIP